MKLKLKFDKTAALGLIAKYVEHVLFAVVVLCFLLLVYKSFARERYDKTPQDLQTAADSAARTIDQTSEPATDLVITDYQATIEEISDPIGEDSYKITKRFNPSVFEKRSKRGEPELYAVEDLRGTAGVGRLEKKMAQAGDGTDRDQNQDPLMQQAEPLGSRWVVLTGLVDLRKQTRAFRDCYKDVVFKNPEFDREPRYYGFWVQRAEVTGSEDPDDLQWEQPYRSLAMELALCATSRSSDKLVDADFRRDRLTFPLPKRLDGDWDQAAAHPPEIPLLDPEEEKQREENQHKPEEPLPGDLDDPGAAFRGLGGQTGFGGGMAGRFDRPTRGGRGMSDGDFEEPSPYLLFRFVDFNVEPGKRYKYRVRLGFYNPNYNVEPRFLIPELQQLIAEDENRTPRDKKWKKYIKSELWSKPSEVVEVPRDDQLLLVSVDPAKRIDSEPEAKVMAVHWDMQNGMRVSQEIDEDINRGKVANFFDQKIDDSQQKRPRGLMPPPRPGREPRDNPRPASRRDRSSARGERDRLLGGPRGEGPAAATFGRQAGGWGGRPALPQSIDYRTECLVLDIRGGERLEGKNRGLTAPGEILLMNPDGSLVVRSDVEDFQRYRKNKLRNQPGRKSRMR